MRASNGNGTSAGLPFDEVMCERYLLGELTDTEQERFESAYFSDDSFLNRFLAVKDDLLDLYSRGELEPHKMRRMGRQFRSTEPRRKRLAEADEFVSAVTRLAERSEVPVRRPFEEEETRAGSFETLRRFFTLPVLATTVGILLVAAFGFWTFTSRRDSGLSADANNESTPLSGSRPRGNEIPGSSDIAAEPDSRLPEVNKSQPTPDRLEDRDVAEDSSRPKIVNGVVRGQSPSPSPPRTEVVQNDLPVPNPVPTLKPPEPKQENAGVRTESVSLDSASRSITKRNTASIGSATQNVAVRLIFGGEPFANYSVRIMTVGGITVWQASGMKAVMSEGPKSLTVTVPVSALSRKDYIVVLAGGSGTGKFETIREYYLHIDRQ